MADSSPLQRELLRRLDDAGPLSRTELALRMGLSKATITALTRDLAEAGLLGVAETVRGAGRPSIRLEIPADAAYFVGVSLVENPVAMVLANMHGAVLARQEIGWSDDATEIGRQIVAGLPALTARHPGVARVLSAKTPYPRVARRGEGTRVVELPHRVVIGGDDAVVIAGPCAVESRDQLEACARAMHSPRALRSLFAS